MAISANMSDALMRAGMSILAANDGSRSGVSAIGMGALQGMDAYAQGAERDQKQEALQTAMQGMPEHMRALAISDPELASNMLAKKHMAEYEQQLLASRPMTPMQQAQMGLQQEQLGLQGDNQQFNQQLAQDKLGLARQQFDFNRQQSQQNLQLKAQEMQQKLATEGQLKPTDLAGMRKEFIAGSKDYVAVRDSYNKISASAASANPIADRSVIFAYMKMLDPASVVREGEQAQAENARAIPDTIRNLYNRVLEGTTLTPEQRLQFTEEAEIIMKTYEDTHKQLRNQYSDLATSFNADPNQVIVDYLPKEDVAGGNAPNNASVVDYSEYFK